MTAAEVVTELAEMGVQVVLSEPGRIRLVCDSGNVPAAAVELAKPHKAELVELLSPADGLQCDDCGSLAFVVDGESLIRADMVQWFSECVEADGVTPMGYQTPPIEPGRGPVTCDKCDADMVRCDIEVQGWRNWDCPNCGHVYPRREASR